MLLSSPSSVFLGKNISPLTTQYFSHCYQVVFIVVYSRFCLGCWFDFGIQSMLRIRNPSGRAKWLSGLRHRCQNSFEKRWFEPPCFRNLLFIIIQRFSTSTQTRTNIPNGSFDAYEVKVNKDIFQYQEKVKLIRNVNPMQREFGDLQNLPQDLLQIQTLCRIESAELKRKEHASLWAYLKVLGLVSKLEEYPDPRLNSFTQKPLVHFFL